MGKSTHLYLINFPIWHSRPHFINELVKLSKKNKAEGRKKIKKIIND